MNQQPQRSEVMHWSLDFAWNRGLENAPAPALGDTLPSEGDGQVGWWRERLQAQGLDLEQVERLLAHYCTATSHSEPVPSAGLSGGIAPDQN